MSNAVDLSRWLPRPSTTAIREYSTTADRRRRHRETVDTADRSPGRHPHSDIRCKRPATSPSRALPGHARQRRGQADGHGAAHVVGRLGQPRRRAHPPLAREQPSPRRCARPRATGFSALRPAPPKNCGASPRAAGPSNRPARTRRGSKSTARRPAAGVVAHAGRDAAYAELGFLVVRGPALAAGCARARARAARRCCGCSWCRAAIPCVWRSRAAAQNRPPAGTACPRR